MNFDQNIESGIVGDDVACEVLDRIASIGDKCASCGNVPERVTPFMYRALSEPESGVVEAK